MRHLLLTLLFLVSISAIGQGYIILNDDTKVKFEKFNDRSDKLVVTVPEKKEKVEIDIKNVKAYFLSEEEILYYKKPIVDSACWDCEKDGWDKYEFSIKYHFLEKKLCGATNFYEKTIRHQERHSAGQPGTFGPTSITETHIYLEKGGRFEHFVVAENVGVAGKKKKIESLKYFVSESPEALKILGEKFKFKYENILNVVRVANLSSFNAKPTSDTSKKAEVIFFRRAKNQAAYKVNITIPGGNFQLGFSDFITVKIPADQLSKICIGQENVCELVEGSTDFKTYFEVGLDVNSAYMLERRTKKEANFYLKEIKSFQEKGK